MAADTLDIISSAEAKLALNISSGDWDAGWDTELEDIVTAASRFVDSVYGPVVKRTVTDERHAGAGDVLTLKYRPVLSVTNVKEYKGGVLTTLTAETETTAGNYRIELSRGRIYRRASWQPYPFGDQAVTVTYVAGRYDTTAVVDRKFKVAAKIAAVHLWQHFGAGSGSASAGGEGPSFGAVPFSSEVLRKKLIDLYPEEVLGSAASPHGPLVA